MKVVADIDNLEAIAVLVISGYMPLLGSVPSVTFGAIGLEHPHSP